MSEVAFRRINGRIVPINIDINDQTRAAKNKLQTIGGISAGIGGVGIITHGISKRSEIIARKLLVKSRNKNFVTRSNILNKIRIISKKIKRSKLGLIGIIAASAGGFAISQGNIKRALQTKALRDEKIENLL
jgi:hypothetical protein